jgi:predicted NAD-dependent protein-ADP-ribosyltransferase YbiA (DUF1768 family)
MDTMGAGKNIQTEPNTASDTLLRYGPKVMGRQEIDIECTSPIQVKSPDGKKIRKKPISYCCTRCGHKCGNRSDLFLHKVRTHGQYGKGDTSKLQPPPWKEGEDPFEDFENSEDIQNVYDKNSIFILAPHLNPYDDTKRVYNFPVNAIITDSDISHQMNYIFRRQSQTYKINISAGAILQHTETGVLRYYKPALNGKLLETAVQVSNKQSLERAINTLQDIDLNEYIRKKFRPDTKYKVVYITQLEYYVFLTGYALGGRLSVLPEYICNNKCILSKDTNTAGILYPENMCLFLSLAKHEKRSLNQSDRDVKKLTDLKYQKWNEYRIQVLGKASVMSGKFEGVQYSELPDIENCFEINVIVMTLQPDGSSTTMYISTTDFKDTVYLHMYENHVNLIVHVDKLTKRHRCCVCERLFKRPQHVRRHMLNCKSKTRYNYPGGYYHQEKSVIDRLAEVGIEVAQKNRFYPYYAVWDMEAMLMKVDQDHDENKKSKLLHQHKAVSCSVCSNVDGYTKPFSIMDQCTTSLTNRMMLYLCEIRLRARSLSYDKWGQSLKTLDELIDETRERESQYESVDSGSDTDQSEGEVGEGEEGKDENVHKKAEDPYLRQLIKLRGDLVIYIEQLIILSFNGGKCDLNLIREEMVLFMFNNKDKSSNELLESLVNVQHIDAHHEIKDVNMEKSAFIKRGNNYLSITNNWFRMLDIINYLAGGTSYSKFLKAFDIKDSKYVFPYTYVDSFEVLSEKELPPFNHICWYSELRDCNLLGEEYEQWKKTGQKGEPPPTAIEKYQQILNDWEKKGWQNMGDYLLFYNSQDVEPFVKAARKLQKLYFSLGVDIFKCSIGLPSASRKMLFQYARDQGVHFALCDKSNKDLYLMMRKHLVAGPAIVFTRFMQVNETLLHVNGKICKSIEGYDFNSLYLSIFSEQMPTGDFVRRFKYDGFRAHYKTVYSKMYYWLKYREIVDNVKIKSRLTDGVEVRAGKYPLDGFCLLDNGVKLAFNFDGCAFHAGCPNKDCKISKRLGNNNVFGDNVADRTLQRNQYLENHGYKHVIITECQFDELVVENQWLSENFDFNARNLFTQKHRSKVTKDQILSGVKDGSLYGFLMVDISVPEHLKSKYKHFPPIFCNEEVTKEYIGDHMQQHISSNDIKINSRRLLVSDMQATEILLSSDLLKFYLTSLDLVCTEVHQVVEYVGKNVFQPFVKEVTKRRLEGAKNPNKEPIANLFKTIGNSSYGSTILNKFRYSRIKHVQGSKQARLEVNDTRFKTLTKLGDSNLYEVESAPARTRIDVPIQVGLMILMSAKRKLLDFYYNFLYKNLEKLSFTIMQIDTDSYYLAFSEETLLASVKPECREEVRSQIYGYCKNERHPDAFLCRDCCPEHRLCDGKFPGLLKLEYKCQTMVCLNSKTYFCYNGDKDVKFSCKGLNKNKVLSQPDPIELYKKTLFTKQSHGAVNTGFKLHKGKMYTYSQEKEAFSYLYLKRKVIGPSGVFTEPLDIMLRPAHQPNILCIQDHCKILSNTFRFPFYHANQCFMTGLQAFVVLAIKHCARIDKQVELLNATNTRDNYQLWSIYRTLTLSDTWQTIQFDVMQGIVESRLLHVNGMKNVLLTTINKELINADGQDPFFGTGENARVVRWISEQDIPGRNYLGKILMTKRSNMSNGN